MTPTQAKAREEAEKIFAELWYGKTEFGRIEALTAALLPHLDRIQKLEKGLKPFADSFTNQDSNMPVGYRGHCRHAAALLKEGK